jgi:cephalosporin-C deacetylase-like acetyl esterase
VRDGIRTAFRPLPEKTPLNPRIWRTSDFEDFRIEHLTYESRPGFLVTANLYLPHQINEPIPGVLFTCGHSDR